MYQLVRTDTICAISTAPGVGAIAVIRLSGPEAISICDKLFSADVTAMASHTVKYGAMRKGGVLLDEVVVTLFKGPNSYTGEDIIEIGCHGSGFIQEQILKSLIEGGSRMAGPGEFTMRAFGNGKMDLSQAEGVADLIAAESEAAHSLAMNQMRGGFSREINGLRDELIHFASLIELELDFAEEDVEFADRQDLMLLVDKIGATIKSLLDSFATGNVVKNGVPVAILGAPNRGKSTLLNAILNEERAIVSSIAGTTRDTVEDTIALDGIQFRFIDTAGLRDTSDEIESMGIERSWEKAREAVIVLYMVDANTVTEEEISELKATFDRKVEGDKKKMIVLANKIDLLKDHGSLPPDVLAISAKEGQGIEELKSELTSLIKAGLNTTSSVITNVRHFDALTSAQTSLFEVRTGLDNSITGDFLAVDIRKALFHLGEITGEITVEDLLGNIFGRFCIGK
ncbi:MAG: tRNA modification GTPase [Litorivivens sp.]|jgi:tRNA modification GTPase